MKSAVLECNSKPARGLAIVRNLVDQDISKVVSVAKSVHQESNYRDISYSTTKAELALANAIQKPNNLVLVFELDGQIVGGFWARVETFYFSEDRYAYDVAFLVSKEVRGRIPFRHMVKRYKQWARACGAKRMNLSQSSGLETNRVSKLYSRLGFAAAGSIHSIV